METDLHSFLAAAHAPPKSKCHVCSKPTTMQCSACSNCTVLRASYCSKACQKVDWKRHKKQCRMLVFYSQVRDLDTTKASTKEERLAIYKTILEKSRPLDVSNEVAFQMLHYLLRVDQSARPQFLQYPHFGVAKVKETVKDAILATRDAYGDAENYMSDYNIRVPKSERDKLDTDKDFEVPFGQRPFHKTMPVGRKVVEFIEEMELSDIPANLPGREWAEAEYKARGNKKLERTDGQGGIQLYPQDYGQLSFDDYVTRFGGEKCMANNPFITQDIVLADGGKQMFAQGLMYGKLRQEGGESVLAMLSV